MLLFEFIILNLVAKNQTRLQYNSFIVTSTCKFILSFKYNKLTLNQLPIVDVHSGLLQAESVKS